MAEWRVACLPAPDGVAVPPCGTVEGTGYAPYMIQEDLPGEISIDGLGELYVYGFTMVLVPFIVATTIGAIIRVIRST